MKSISLFSGYIYLILAIITGIASNGFLKTTEGFTRLNPTIFCVASIILCLFCLKFSRFSTRKWSQSFLSKVSLRHYHKLEPVEESIELSGKPGADSKFELNTVRF